MRKLLYFCIFSVVHSLYILCTIIIFNSNRSICTYIITQAIELNQQHIIKASQEIIGPSKCSEDMGEHPSMITLIDSEQVHQVSCQVILVRSNCRIRASDSEICQTSQENNRKIRRVEINQTPRHGIPW